jgi:hypothetical protein
VHRILHAFKIHTHLNWFLVDLIKFSPHPQLNLSGAVIPTFEFILRNGFDTKSTIEIFRSAFLLLKKIEVVKISILVTLIKDIASK